MSACAGPVTYVEDSTGSAGSHAGRLLSGQRQRPPLDGLRGGRVDGPRLHDVRLLRLTTGNRHRRAAGRRRHRPARGRRRRHHGLLRHRHRRRGQRLGLRGSRDLRRGLDEPGGAHVGRVLAGVARERQHAALAGHGRGWDHGADLQGIRLLRGAVRHRQRRGLHRCGIQFPTVADNSSTTFYATATDAVGNVSSCSDRARVRRGLGGAAGADRRARARVARERQHPAAAGDCFGRLDRPRLHYAASCTGVRSPPAPPPSSALRASPRPPWPTTPRRPTTSRPPTRPATSPRVRRTDPLHGGTRRPRRPRPSAASLAPTTTRRG